MVDIPYHTTHAPFRVRPLPLLPPKVETITVTRTCRCTDYNETTTKVKLVGCIVEMDDASTNTEYTIEDTTGRLKVQQ